jgi:16S rRNA C967 or C1407 C5-methylase (RsmB/RsmF family)
LIFERGEKYYKNFMKKLKNSLLPLDEEVMKKVVKIENCMRLLPHDNDSGGFFVVLIKKKGHHLWVK